MGDRLLRKGLVVGIIVLFIGSNFVSGLNIQLKNTTGPLINSRGNTLYVGGSGPGNYSDIQDAIDDANNGDTVFVYDDSSPYYENVEVDKSINLIGEDKDTTIIDGGWMEVVSVSADWVNISGFTIQNSSDRGITIYSCYTTTSGNTITNNDEGIYLEYSDKNTISYNNITNNWMCGINLFGDNNTISHNDITNTITNNKCVGIWTDGDSNTISGNNITNNNWDGIWIEGDSNTISDNYITNNDDGICFFYRTQYNNIINNNISNNDDGVLFLNSHSNNIKGNTISNNYGYGIYFRDVNGVTGNNRIYYNNFINNIQNAYDESNNKWDDRKKGNYWSDYEEKYPDAHKIWLKGIWDTPYMISGWGNKDNYPLIKQWSKSKSKTITKNIASYSYFLLSK